MRTILIAAVAWDRAIGQNGKIPWHEMDMYRNDSKEDLRRFRELTMGNPIVMGRKTFDSIYERNKKPLKGRQNIVVTRKGNYVDSSIMIARTIDEAIAIAAGLSSDIYVIGGAEIYRQTIDSATHLRITEVPDIYPEADAHFPEIKENDWKIENVRELEHFRFVDYVKRSYCNEVLDIC